MAHLIAKRGAADFPKWEPIVDPLLCAFAPLYERARVELDSTAHGLQSVNLELLYRPGVAPGQWLEVIDMLTGEHYIAKIRAVSLEGDGIATVMKLTVERPTIE